MKKITLCIFSAISLLAFYPLAAQKKLAISDNTQLFTQDVESALKNRLEADTIELTSIVDTRKRCEYWFATLNKEGNDLTLSVKDCKDKIAGSKNLGSRIYTANDSEKALLLYYSISEILRNPYRNVAEPANLPLQKPDTAFSGNQRPPTDPGQHRTRYFFAPSSYNLEKGELYYNTVYFFVHDVQYGITDRFSVGMGTTLLFIPFYITPKLTIPVNEKSSFALGDILMLGTWGSKFNGNLLYATYTRGGYYNNITIGGGYLHTNESESINKTNAPVFNLSALLRLSGHIYFLTENYSSYLTSKQEAHYYNPITFQDIYEEFDQNVFFIYGMAGFRFINRNKDVNSWQFGLSYIYTAYGELPSYYQSSYWYTDAMTHNRFIAFPVIGYARKFSTRY